MSTPPRDAEERRRSLAAFGLPEAARYGRMTLTGLAGGRVAYRFALILPDGREASVATFPSADAVDWPDPYVITVYGVFGPPVAATLALPGIPVTLLYPLFFADAQADAAAPAPRGPGMTWLWATVCYGTSVVYGVVRAHPDGTLTEELGGLEARHTAPDRERAYQGLPYLRRRVQQKTSAVPPAAEFLEACEAAAAILRRMNRELTQENLLRHLPYQRTRFTELRAAYAAQGHPWATDWAALRRRLFRSPDVDDDAPPRRR